MNKPAKVASDKRALIAEALLAGCDPAAIRQRLIDSGVSPPAADYELKRADKDPLFQAASRLRRDLAKSHWVLGNIRALGRQSGAEAIPTAATPAKSSGAMNLSLAIMFLVYHQDQPIQTSNFQRILCVS